jgi:hypothetical protein
MLLAANQNVSLDGTAMWADRAVRPAASLKRFASGVFVGEDRIL